MKKIILIASVLLLFNQSDIVTGTESDKSFTPIQVGIFNPIQIFPEDWEVKGLKLNLPYSKNNTTGIDFGLIGYGDFMRGIQINLLWNMIDNCKGIQIGSINSGKLAKDYEFSGIQIGLLQNGRFFLSLLTPLQLTVGKIKGVQLSSLNAAKYMRGVQFGTFNFVTESMSGLQIGLLNYNRSSIIPIFPFINFGYGKKIWFSDEQEKQNSNAW